MARALVAQHEHGVRIERDQAFGVGGLGRCLRGVPSVLHDLVGDLERGGVEVGIGAALSAGFASPESGVCYQVEQGIQRVVDYVVEELAGEFGCPYHDRAGDLPGFPPPLHPLRGPHLGCRPLGGRQFHQGGHVDRKEPLLHGGSEGRAEGVADSAQRAGADRPLILHGGDLAWVAAGAVLPDQFVVLDDRVEHAVQVPDPQLVAPDMGEVRP
nr:hypothetical protein [Amycolatopsis aidingensis]